MKFQSVVENAKTVYKGALYMLNLEDLNRTNFDNEHHRITHQVLSEMEEIILGCEALYTILGDKVDTNPISVRELDDKFGALCIRFTQAIDAYKHDKVAYKLLKDAGLISE